jgi:hypothetical protein
MRYLLVGIVVSLVTVAPAADKKLPEPAAGTKFHVMAGFPKYVTADIEFRDPTDKLWPNFFYGKPDQDGALLSDPKQPTAQNIVLKCDHLAQKNGEQDRRVLGELLTAGKSPVVRFTLKALQPLQSETVKVEVKEGKFQDKVVNFFPAEGTLDLDGKALPITGKLTLKPNYDKDKTKVEALYAEVTATVPGSTLGLKAVPTVAIRVGFTGYADTKDAKKK